ncbi:MAG: DUF3575 domain-containing protein, partial [Bacteroidales bacterium]|nr:DUF3575 domain-containing protein [Bacteroidales bacterium]
MGRRLLTIAFLLLVVWSARADDVVLITTSQAAFAAGDASITFRVDDAVIDPRYMDNPSQLERLAACIDRFRMNIDSVTIVAFASPEGRYAYNQRLSARRAKAMHDYLLEKWPDVHFGRIREYAAGPDFKGLAELLESDLEIPYRDEVMPLVSAWKAVPGAMADAPFRRLMSLRDSVPYAYIHNKYLPWLRNATTVIFHYNPSVSLYEKADTTAVPALPDSPVAQAPQDARPEAASGSTAPDTLVNVVSVYVPPVTTGKSDVAGLLPPVADAGGLLPPVVADGSDVLPPGMTDSSAVAPVVAKYVIDDPVAPSTPVVPATRVNPETQTAPAEQAVKDTVKKKDRVEKKPREPRPARKRMPFLEGLEPVAAFSTNLLFDAVTAINLAFEYPLSDAWTMRVEGIFPWWTWNNQANAFQINHLNLGLRYWLGGLSFTGWHTDAGLGGGRYDIEPSSAGFRGWEGMVSLGGGYALPLSDH